MESPEDDKSKAGRRAPATSGDRCQTSPQRGQWLGFVANEVEPDINWARSYGADNTANTPGPYRVGLFRPSSGTFYLDVSADGTFQARAFLGQAGDMVVGLPVIQNGQVIGATQLGSY